MRFPFSLGAQNTQNSQFSHTQMVMVDDPDNFEREGTAELKNDPRFFTENVIDKRLAAFEAVAIVTELLSAEAVRQCFDLCNEYKFVGELWWAGIIEVIGFGLMCSVMFMSMIAVAVLSLQLFFTIRLMTASPTGFDKAARFYQDRSMWWWRERAIFGVKYSLVTFVLSTGLMLFVKFYVPGGLDGLEKDQEALQEVEYHLHQIGAIVVFCVFMVMSCVMWLLVRTHQRVFDLCYSSLDICHNELNRHLVSNRLT